MIAIAGWPAQDTLCDKILKKRSPHTELSAQSSLSIFSQKYLLKCEDTYLILQNKYLHIYEDSFGAKIPRDDYTQNLLKHFARL